MNYLSSFSNIILIILIIILYFIMIGGQPTTRWHPQSTKTEDKPEQHPNTIDMMNAPNTSTKCPPESSYSYSRIEGCSGPEPHDDDNCCYYRFIPTSTGHATYLTYKYSLLTILFISLLQCLVVELVILYVQLYVLDWV